MEGLKPSLREREHRELPVAREQACDNVPEGRGPLRKAPAPETVHTLDHEMPTRDEKQDHIIEPSHYYGISR